MIWNPKRSFLKLAVILTAASWFCMSANASALTLRGNTYDLRGELNVADLEALPFQEDIKTSTPWSNERKFMYRGVDLLKLLGAKGLANARTLQISAENGFSTEIAITLINKFHPIIATQIECDDELAKDRDCKLGEFTNLTTKDYGPLFIVWPREMMNDALDRNDHSRWVWFLSEIKSIE